MSDTRGAGPDVKRRVPSKRIKAMHRKSLGGASLRGFARFIGQDQNEDEKSRGIAQDWMRGKGVQP